MNFKTLRETADKYAEMWGMLNSAQKPDWSDYVNKAYRKFSWDTECVHGPSVTLSSVSLQAEYTLPLPDWKDVEDVYLDGNTLRRYNEHSVRRTDPAYFIRDPSTSTGYWIPRPGVIRLHPIPATGGTNNMIVYGIRAPADLAADTDVPALPEVYHEAIAIFAADLHTRKYARGESEAAREQRISMYTEMMQNCKEEQEQRLGMDAYRYVSPVVPDRVL